MKTQTEPSKKALKATQYHVVVFAAAVGVLIVGGMWRGGKEITEGTSEAALIEQLRQEVSGLQIGVNRDELNAIQSSMTKAAVPIARSIVSVRPLEGVQTLRAIPVYNDLVNSPKASEPASATLSPGMSGIVIDKEGHVLTSANVVNLGTRVQLMLADGTERAGEVVGVDGEEFVGLVKISSPPENMVSPDFSKPASDFISGQWLIRHGRSPTGRASLALSFMESVRQAANGRAVGFLDSAGAPEIDGGVLIDMNGRVVGLYAAPRGSPAFVLPIERALNVANRIKTSPKRIPQSWAGLELQELTEDLLGYFGPRTGVVVASVLANSPAARAGLRPGDIIRTIDESAVTSAAELTRVIGDKPPGTAINVGIQRRSQSRSVSVVTAALSQEGVGISANEQTLRLKVEDRIGAVGATIVDLRPTGLANRLGLLSGDVIKGVNDRPVRRSSELIQWLKILPAGKPRLFQIKRGDQTFFIGIKEPVNINE